MGGVNSARISELTKDHQMTLEVKAGHAQGTE